MDDNPALARQMVDKPSTTLREDDPKLAHEIVDKLIAGLPDGDTSLRPVHAFGIGATGFSKLPTSRATSAAPGISRATGSRSPSGFQRFWQRDQARRLVGRTRHGDAVSSA